MLLEAAQEGKLTLLSIIVSPCLIHETPLAAFQMTNTQPLSLLSKSKREEAWAEIARMITAALSSQKNTREE